MLCAIFLEGARKHVARTAPQTLGVGHLGGSAVEGRGRSGQGTDRLKPGKVALDLIKKKKFNLMVLAKGQLKKNCQPLK